MPVLYVRNNIKVVGATILYWRNEIFIARDWFIDNSSRLKLTKYLRDCVFKSKSIFYKDIKNYCAIIKQIKYGSYKNNYLNNIKKVVDL